MGYDPLFNKFYMEREKTHPEMSCTVRYSGTIPVRDLPKAGRPWNIPPPSVEGQTGTFYFYDDKTLDGYVRLEAIEISGKLQWLVLHKELTHRQMVGTNWELEK